MLYGIKPVIISIVVQALVGLGRTALNTPLAAGWAALVLVLYLLGIHELVLLFAGGALFALVKHLGNRPARGRPAALPSIVVQPGQTGLWVGSAQAMAAGGGAAAAAAAVPFSLGGYLESS